MEKNIKDLPDFDEWLQNYKPEPIKYLAAFESDTGKVVSVGPDHAIPNDKYPNTIAIDARQAEAIISGEIKLSKCFVDPNAGELEIVEHKDLFKIDDVLHRIVNSEWSSDEKPDVFLEYDKKSSRMTIKLSEELGGTHKLDKKFHPIVKRKMFWDGDTILSFSITEYNDPHLVHDTIEVTLSELTGKAKSVEVNCPEKFSVYTRRLLKNYVIEEK